MYGFTTKILPHTLLVISSMCSAEQQVGPQCAHHPKEKLIAKVHWQNIKLNSKALLCQSIRECVLYLRKAKQNFEFTHTDVLAG